MKKISLFLLILFLLTACSSSKPEDVSQEIWDSSLEAYQMVSDSAGRPNVSFTDEEETFLNDYMEEAMEILFSEQYTRTEKDIVNEVSTILFSLAKYEESNDPEILNAIKDNLENLEEIYGR